MKQNFFAVDLGATSDRTILGTKELQDYDVTMWEKHGVFAVDCDAMQAFDQIDVLNKFRINLYCSQECGLRTGWHEPGTDEGNDCCLQSS